MSARVAEGVAAALLLARGRAEALTLLPNDGETARHSFRAALICLPAFLGLRLIAWDEGEPEAGLVLGLLAEVAGFVIAWAGFALASHALAARAGRAERWPQFIAAWNWSNLIQYGLLVLLALPAALGLPPWLGNGLMLAALGYALWLEWFVTRAGLGLPGGAAAMFVVVDLAIGILVGGVTARLAGG